MPVVRRRRSKLRLILNLIALILAASAVDAQDATNDWPEVFCNDVHFDTNEDRPNFTGGEGQDTVFVWRYPTDTTRFSIDTCDLRTTFDTQIWLYNDSSLTPEHLIFWNDDCMYCFVGSENENGTQSYTETSTIFAPNASLLSGRLEIGEMQVEANPLVPGQLVWVVVDGHESVDMGSFALHIRCQDFINGTMHELQDGAIAELFDLPHQNLQRLATENPANFFLLGDSFGSLGALQDVPSLEECAEVCQQDPMCMSFSFTPYDNKLCVTFPDLINATAADQLLVPMPIQSGNIIYRPPTPTPTPTGLALGEILTIAIVALFCCSLLAFFMIRKHIRQRRRKDAETWRTKTLARGRKRERDLWHLASERNAEPNLNAQLQEAQVSVSKLNEVVFVDPPHYETPESSVVDQNPDGDAAELEYSRSAPPVFRASVDIDAGGAETQHEPNVVLNMASSVDNVADDADADTDKTRRNSFSDGATTCGATKPANATDTVTPDQYDSDPINNFTPILVSKKLELSPISTQSLLPSERDPKLILSLASCSTSNTSSYRRDSISTRSTDAASDPLPSERDSVSTHTIVASLDPSPDAASDPLTSEHDPISTHTIGASLDSSPDPASDPLPSEHDPISTRTIGASLDSSPDAASDPLPSEHDPISTHTIIASLDSSPDAASEPRSSERGPGTHTIVASLDSSPDAASEPRSSERGPGTHTIGASLDSSPDAASDPLPSEHDPGTHTIVASLDSSSDITDEHSRAASASDHAETLEQPSSISSLGSDVIHER